MSSFACANRRTWAYLTLCTIWKPLLFCPEDWYRKRFLASLFGKFLLARFTACPPSFLPPISFPWVKGAGSFFCFVLIFFFLFTKAHLLLPRRKRVWHVHPHLAGFAALQRGLAESAEVFRHRSVNKHHSEDGTASQRTGLQRFYLCSIPTHGSSTLWENKRKEMKASSPLCPTEAS